MMNMSSMSPGGGQPMGQATAPTATMPMGGTQMPMGGMQMPMGGMQMPMGGMQMPMGGMQGCMMPGGGYGMQGCMMPGSGYGMQSPSQMMNPWMSPWAQMQCPMKEMMMYMCEGIKRHCEYMMMHMMEEHEMMHHGMMHHDMMRHQ